MDAEADRGPAPASPSNQPGPAAARPSSRRRRLPPLDLPPAARARPAQSPVGIVRAAAPTGPPARGRPRCCRARAGATTGSRRAPAPRPGRPPRRGTRPPRRPRSASGRGSSATTNDRVRRAQQPDRGLALRRSRCVTCGGPTRGGRRVRRRRAVERRGGRARVSTAGSAEAAPCSTARRRDERAAASPRRGA